MMLRLLVCMLLSAALLPQGVQASELKVLPGEITLTGPGATQRLLVVVLL